MQKHYPHWVKQGLILQSEASQRIKITKSIEAEYKSKYEAEKKETEPTLF